MATAVGDSCRWTYTQKVDSWRRQATTGWKRERQLGTCITSQKSITERGINKIRLETDRICSLRRVVIGRRQVEKDRRRRT
jgi:hypothetical protein